MPPFLRPRFKMVARTLLGMAVASFVFGAIAGLKVVHDYPWSRLGLAALMFGIYKLLATLRHHRPNDPCADCPLGHFPVCEWNLPALLANTNDPLLSAIGSTSDVVIIPAGRV